MSSRARPGSGSGSGVRVAVTVASTRVQATAPLAAPSPSPSSRGTVRPRTSEPTPNTASSADSNSAPPAKRAKQTTSNNGVNDARAQPSDNGAAVAPQQQSAVSSVPTGPSEDPNGVAAVPVSTPSSSLYVAALQGAFSAASGAASVVVPAISSGAGLVLGRLSSVSSAALSGFRPFGVVALQGAIQFGGFVEERVMAVMPDARKARAEAAARDKKELEDKLQQEHECQLQAVNLVHKRHLQAAAATAQELQQQRDRERRTAESTARQLKRAQQIAAAAEETRRQESEQRQQEAERRRLQEAAVFKCADMRSGEFHVVLIGQTGAGKSSLINLLASFCRAASQCQGFETAQPVTMVARAAVQTASETQTCTAYRLDPLRCGDRTVRFVLHDTPGFADTDGKDVAHVDNILKHLEKQPFIHAVVLVMDGSDPRLEKPSARTVFQMIQANFPDCLMKQLLVAYTRVDQVPTWFSQVNSRLRAAQSVTNFALNNAIFAAGATSELRKLSFRAGLTEAGKLLRMINKCVGVPQSQLQLFVLQHQHVVAQVHACLERIKTHMQTQNLLRDALRAMASAAAGVDAHRNFMRSTTQTVFTLVPTGRHNTLCAKCHHTCHRRCGLQETSGRGNHALRGCQCMGGGYSCNECPGRCSVSEHFHSREEYKQSEKTLHEILTHVKEAYDGAQQQLHEHSTQADQLKQDQSNLDAAVAHEQRILRGLCNQLRTNCSDFNFTQLLDPTLTKLKSERVFLRDPDAREANQKQIDELKKLLQQFAE